MSYDPQTAALLTERDDLRAKLAEAEARADAERVARHTREGLYDILQARCAALEEGLGWANDSLSEFDAIVSDLALLTSMDLPEQAYRVACQLWSRFTSALDQRPLIGALLAADQEAGS